MRFAPVEAGGGDKNVRAPLRRSFVIDTNRYRFQHSVCATPSTARTVEVGKVGSLKGALYSKGWLMNDGSALARRSSPSGKLTLNLGTPLSDPSVLSDGQAPGRRRRIAFGETSDRSIVVAIEDRAIVCAEREPSEVAEAILFLASDQASFITGA